MMKDIRSGFSNVLSALRLLSKVSTFYLTITLLLSITTGLMTPLSLQIWQKLIDSIIQTMNGDSSNRSFLLYLLASAGLSLITVFLSRLNQYITQIYANEMEYKITERILLKVSDFSMEQYDDPKTYNMISMAIKETPNRCLNILGSITTLITCVSELIGCAVLLASFGCAILVLSTASAIPLFWTDYLNNKYWYATFAERVEKNRLISYLKELLIRNENIKELKLFQNSQVIISKITDMYNDFLLSDRKVRKRYAIRSGGVGAIDIANHLIVNTIIILSSVASKATIGQVTMQISSAESFRAALNLFFNELSIMHEHSMYIESLGKLDKTSEMLHAQLNPMPKEFHEITFAHVCFTYPGTEQVVLNDISLTLQSDKSYAVVGLNGSGKTTLLKLLLKLYQPTSGSILLDGVNINDIETDTYYRSISAIYQDFIHFPFSVRENITGATIGSESRVVGAASLSSADQFISDLPLGYDSMLMKEWNDGVELSLGQWQKIAISRCFYRDSLIYILDEPFSALDPLAEIQVIRNVRRKKQGKLCLFITHRMTSIVLADEIIVLEKGVLKGKGSHSQLIIECPLYKQLYDAQAEAFTTLSNS